MIYYLKLIKKTNLYIIFLILVIAHFTSFFTNIYTIHKRDYDERILRTYDYCTKYSYGYINKIYAQYLRKIKKVYIINFEPVPESYGLFHELKKDDSKTNNIIINYKKERKDLINQLNIDLKDYNLIDNDEQCYYYQKIK
jgi:hypothetical protein